MEIKNALKKEYEIKSYDVNYNNKLKISSLLHLLEDIAYESAERLGFGYTDVYTKGLGWFVVKYRIEIKELPSAWDKIKIKTWPNLNKGVTCRRDFEIYKDEKIIGKAASLWAVVDLNTKRLLNPFKTLNFPELDDVHALDTDFGKIESPERIQFQKDILIRLDDIDLNGHVNNSNYVAWALDAMGYEFLDKYAPCAIEIDYKKEATKEDEIIHSIAQYFENQKYSVHSLKKQDDTEVAQIKIYWK